MKRFYDSIVDEAGNIVVGAEMYVRDNTTLELVTIYSDDGSTVTANPTTSGNDGYVSFWTADAVLKLEIYIDGELEKTITDYQHYDDRDAELLALRGLTSAANKVPYFTGSGTAALADFTAFARTIVDDADAAAVLTTIGAQPLDTDLTAIAALTSAADKGLQSTGAGTWALYDLTAAGKALLDDANAAAQRTTLGLGSAATFDEATAAQYRANAADKVLSTDAVWAAAASVALTPGTNVATDLSTGINFTLAMGGNYTLDNPTNMKAGQTGCIEITQDGTGSRTLAYGTAWKFAGGSDPVLSTAASAKDLLLYQVLADGASVYATLVKAIA